MPIHFGENPPNVLTNAEAFDPLAKIPEFKVSASGSETFHDFFSSPGLISVPV
jgi:hypothetical protein